MPYLPIDPSDVGSSYKESVRVNSQSGKGGVGFVLEEHYGIYLPREMLVEFSRTVQALTEETQSEVSPDQMFKALVAEFQEVDGPYKLDSYSLAKKSAQETEVRASVHVAESQVGIVGNGSGPIEAFINGLIETLNEPLQLLDFRQHAISIDGQVGKGASAIGIVAIGFEDMPVYGVGVSPSTVTASLVGVLSAMNRRWRRTERTT